MASIDHWLAGLHHDQHRLFRIYPRLDAVGRWLSPLALRTLLAWEFFESGREKLGGQNWFADRKAASRSRSPPCPRR